MEAKPLIVLIVFFARQTLSRDCKVFHSRWRSTCPLTNQLEECSYISVNNQKLEITRTEVNMDCDYKEPDKNAIPCLPALYVRTLTMTDCQFPGLRFEQIVDINEPSKVTIQYTQDKSVDFRIIFNISKNILIISFRNVTAQEKFPVTFGKNSMKLKFLRIDGHNFKVFQRSFENLKGLRELSIKHGPLERLEEDTLHGLSENFAVLDLSSNSIHTISPRTFSEITKLETLYLSKNKLKYLTYGLFTNLGNLRRLKLDGNLIRIIPNGIFGTLTNLDLLDISDNPITSLPEREAFGPSRMLTVLAQHCKLRKMPNISWNRHLTISIDLSHNYINHPVLPVCSLARAKVKLNFNTISSITLRETCSLKSKWFAQYYLANNKPKCDCKLRNFLYFIRSNPEITSMVFPDFDQLYCREENVSLINTTAPCPETDCPTNCTCNNRICDCSGIDLSDPPHSVPLSTTIANLANNKINSLTKAERKYWNHVTHLNVSNNLLNSLEGWSYPARLRILDISYNNLRNLPRDFMLVVERSLYFKIYLSNNEWTCDCEFLVFRQWFLANKRHILDYDNTVCELQLTNGSIGTALIKDVYTEDFCPAGKAHTYIHLLLLSLILIGFLLYSYYYRSTIVALFYSLDPLKRFFKDDHREAKIYDAFICSSDIDSPIVLEIVLHLEPYYRLCVPARDWPQEGSGCRISKHVAHSLNNSRASLIIISQHSLREIWFHVKVRGAYNQRLEDGLHKMILIVVGDIGNICAKHDIQEIIDTEPRLLWGERFLWQKLRYRLRGHKRMLRSYKERNTNQHSTNE